MRRRDDEPGKILIEPAVLIIFGACGDLTKRKLVPALYNLFLDGRLPDKFAIFGLDLNEMNDEAFREHLRKGVDEFSRRGKAEQDSWQDFAEHIHFETADLTAEKTYSSLAEKLSEQETFWEQPANRIFYAALPPDMIETVTNRLASARTQ